MNIGYCLYGYPIKSQTWIPLEIKELEKRGHLINIIDVTKPMTREIVEKIKESEFLICHWSYTGLSIKRWGKPFGILCHAYDIWKDNGATLKQVSKANNCKFVGCDTEYHRNRYLEWGIEKPLLDTPVCCDTDFFIKKKPNLGDKVVTGGRDKEKKGFEYAVKGFDNLYVFGNNSLKRLESINPTTKYTSWLDNEGLRGLLDDSWLFVSPNVPGKDGDMDGQCTTIKEALAMELQVLTTPIAGNSEYEHVYFSTAEDISNKKHPNIPKERNTKGREFVVKKFSPKACIDKYIEAIEQCNI